jgi:transposase
MDLGDRTSHICVLDEAGTVVERSKVQTTREGMQKRFERAARMRIALEVGTHSPWVSRLLKELGHEVLVANPRKTRLIYQNRGKQDPVDAEALARIARLDPKLLYPVEHRPESVAQDLAVLRARDVLVRTRTQLINHIRGAVKATGHRLKKCSTRTFSEKAVDEIPEQVREALSSVVATIEVVSRQILALDKRIRDLGRKKYPETALLRQVGGVGPIVALAYVLTLEHPGRFRKSRAVGPYLGLVPARSQSGESDPQLRITKEGDALLRRLLVQSAQYVLGPFGPDCDLRRSGLSLSARGEHNAKKRAVIAVARKLAVLLHRLWRTAEVYEPLRKAPAAHDAAAAA